MSQVYIRTCQECGYELQCEAPNMDKEFTKAFEFKACPKCKSEAFDLGSFRVVPPYTEAEAKYIKSLEDLE